MERSEKVVKTAETEIFHILFLENSSCEERLPPRN